MAWWEHPKTGRGRRAVLTMQVVSGAVVVVATLFLPNPLDGWDYVGAIAFGLVGLLALRELVKGESRRGGDSAR